MSKSTPITQLSGNEEDASNTNPAIVQDILNEIQQQDEQVNMQPNQPPIMQTPPPNLSTVNYQMDTQVMPQIPAQEVEQPPMQLSMPEPTPSMMQNILENAKDPASVVLLAFVMNLPMVENILIKYVPKIVNNLGQMNYLGMLLKAVIIGVLFFTTKKLLN